MIPGIDPRQMKQAMKKMGMSQVDIDADLVVIHTKGKEILIHQPSVAKISMMGQESFQISGKVEERSKTLEISSADVRLVMEQAKVSEDEAKQALEENGGDIAAAILSLEEQWFLVSYHLVPKYIYTE